MINRLKHRQSFYLGYNNSDDERLHFEQRIDPAEDSEE